MEHNALFAPAQSAVVRHLDPEEAVVVMMDDTLIRKRGRKIHGTAWKRDPLGPHWRTNFVWGQRYLQISAALPERDRCGRAVGIPIDFIHAPSARKPGKKAPTEAWTAYKSQQKAMTISSVAVTRLHELSTQLPGRQIICAVDGGYTNQTVFRNLPQDTTLIGRVRKDARLYQAPVQSTVSRGRKKYYGEPLPTPETIRQDDSIPWQEVEAFAAGKRHTFDVKAISGIRWRGTADQDIQLVIIRPLAYRPSKGAALLYRNPAYLICTDPHLPLEKLLQAYLWRWEIELNFRDEKTVLGVGEAQVRTPSSVQSAPALAVAAYAYLLLAARVAYQSFSALPRPKWQITKPTQRPSTQQMIALFRAQLWGIAIHSNKTHFNTHNSPSPNPSFFSNRLHTALFFARK